MALVFFFFYLSLPSDSQTVCVEKTTTIFAFVSRCHLSFVLEFMHFIIHVYKALLLMFATALRWPPSLSLFLPRVRCVHRIRTSVYCGDYWRCNLFAVEFHTVFLPFGYVFYLFCSAIFQHTFYLNALFCPSLF